MNTCSYCRVRKRILHVHSVDAPCAAAAIADYCEIRRRCCGRHVTRGAGQRPLRACLGDVVGRRERRCRRRGASAGRARWAARSRAPSQSMFIMTCRSGSSSNPPCVNARRAAVGSFQPGRVELAAVPRQMSFRPRSFDCAGEEARAGGRLGCRLRKAIICWKKRSRSAFCSGSVQSNQLISLSWQ